MDVDDVFDSRCRIGQMAGQITTRLGTVTLQVVTSSLVNLRLWHGCIFSSVPERFLTINIKNVTFDLVDLYLTMSTRHIMYM